jgi:putative spermidine/putrescine transport system ATP-binding protein
LERTGRPTVSAVVELQQVSKTFGRTPAVEECSLSVFEGEFVSFLGPSGSGKTTTLRMIAGFATPSTGAIRIRGKNVVGVPPRNRNIAMVFQNYALFPHLTVAQNIAFGLEVRRVDKREVADRVERYLRLVQLSGYEKRLPKELSGGEQQRVALARALVTEPEVLLLDEPLGALDRKLREDLQSELKEVLTRVGITAIYVTHDQDEALVMSDRVVVMSKGRIEQIDTPEGLYERPRTRFVAGFVGTSNLFEGHLQHRGTGIALDAGEIVLQLSGAQAHAAEGVRSAAIRPENVRVSRDADGSEPNALRGVVVDARYLGASTHYRIKVSAAVTLIASVVNAEAGVKFVPGEDVAVILPPDAIRLLADGPSSADRHRGEVLAA